MKGSFFKLISLSLFLLGTVIAQAEEGKIFLLDQNLALVQQKRVVYLNKGLNEVNFHPVDEGIILESVCPYISGCSFLEQRFVLPSILFWKVESEVEGQRELTLSYLTRGIKWSINYRMEIKKEEKYFNLYGLLNVENKGKVNWWNTELAFIEKINYRQIETKEKEEEERVAIANYIKNVWIKPYKDILFFYFKRPITLEEEQIKSFPLFSLFKLPLEKTYLADGQKYGEVVREEISFFNPFKPSSNFVLPGGHLYIYQELPDGEKLYLGEGELTQTLPGEIIQIYLGPARGIKAQRIQTFYREIELSEVEKRVYKKEVAREYGYKIVLSNFRSYPVNVKVVEHFYDWWEILESEPPSYEKAKDKIIYNIKIPPQGRKIVNYRAKII